MSLFSDAEQSNNSPCKQDLDVQWAEFEVSEMHFIGSLTNSAVWCFLSCCFFFFTSVAGVKYTEISLSHPESPFN